MTHTVYIVGSARAFPRFINLTYARLGRAAQSLPGWRVVKVGKRWTADLEKKVNTALHHASTVIVTPEFLKLAWTVAAKVFRTVLTKHPSARRVMLLGDVTPLTLERRKAFRPHVTVSPAGHLLPAFAKGDTSAWLPHCGFEFPFDVSRPRFNNVYVPMHHFATTKPTRHAAAFYKTRIAVTKALRHNPGVVFQPAPLHGPPFYDAMARYVAAVTTIPSTRRPFVVAKFWEVMSVGCLLIAVLGPSRHLWASLGFEDGVHYVAATVDDVKEKVAWALDPANRDAVDTMRRAGRDAVLANHLPHHRLLALHHSERLTANHSK